MLFSGKFLTLPNQMQAVSGGRGESIESATGTAERGEHILGEILVFVVSWNEVYRWILR